MKYRIYTLLLLLAISEHIAAQAQFSGEKIYVHCDKNWYLPGETVWFKAWIRSGQQPTTVSTNLYAVLADSSGKALERKVLPIFDGGAEGSFVVPAAGQGCTWLALYTASQWYADKASMYYHYLPLYPVNNKRNTVSNAAQLHFFPEGGRLITGVQNYVGIQAADVAGRPATMSGIIVDDLGQEHATFQTGPLGTGLVQLEPGPGRKYTARWQAADGKSLQETLPAATDNGAALHLEQVKDRLYYLLKTPQADNDSLHIVMRTAGKIVYAAAVYMKGQYSYTNYIDAAGMPSGLLEFTLLNQQRQPLATRQVLMNSGDSQFPVLVKKTGPVKDGSIACTLTLPDTIAATLSASITDYEQDMEMKEDIRSALLLPGVQSGLPGNELLQRADEWLLTHPAPFAPNAASMSAPSVKENYITLQAESRDISGQPLSVVINSSDKNRSFYFFQPDKASRYKEDGFVFYDSVTIQYKLTGNEVENTGIIFDSTNGWLPPVALTLPDCPQPLPLVVDSTRKKILNAAPSVGAGKDRQMLTGVTVKGRRNLQTQLERVDRKYTTGFFAGGSNVHAFDIANDPMAETTNDIFNYIAFRAPRLFLKYSAAGKQLYFRRSSGFAGPTEMLVEVFVNESLTNQDLVQNLQIKDIAYIKMIESFSGITTNMSVIGGVPALAIYLKKGADDKLIKDEKKYRKIKVPGYAPPGIFEQSISETGVNTLYWNGNIQLDASNRSHTITFKTGGDSPRPLLLTIQGMTVDGRLIHYKEILR